MITNFSLTAPTEIYFRQRRFELHGDFEFARAAFAENSFSVSFENRNTEGPPRESLVFDCSISSVSISQRPRSAIHGKRDSLLIMGYRSGELEHDELYISESGAAYDEIEWQFYSGTSIRAAAEIVTLRLVRHSQ